MKKLLQSLLIVSFFALVPASVSAAAVGAPPPLDYSGFVKCDGVVKKDADGKLLEPERNVVCDFAALMNTINKGINWMFYISIPIAGVLFAYAGLLYITGKPGNRTKANGLFTSVAIGFIIMVTAWFVVRTVVSWFVDPDFKATIFLDGK
jgi:hypothetical protein